MKNARIIILIACSVMIFGLFGSISAASAFAADNNNSDDKNKKKDEIDYTLDKEVKEWLDEGNSIPSEVKYSTLGSSSHLWMLDDTDVSDGKVELTGNGDEKTILAGIALRDWLKTQSFYGEKLGDPDNKIEFKRPKKSKPF